MVAARLVPILFLATLSWGADPFIGSWKLNISKSEFRDTPRAQSGTASYTAEGDGYMYSSETIFTEDAVSRLRGPVLFDGTVNEGKLNGRPVTFVSKKVNENSYETIFTDKETGKVTQTFRYSVSPEEKTLTYIWLKTGEETPVMKLIYDKQ